MQPALGLRGFRSPVRLLQWQVAVTNKPSEGNGSILDGSVFEGLPTKSNNLPFQFLSRLRLRHF